VRFLDPLNNASVNLCPTIDGFGPDPTDGQGLYVIVRFVTLSNAHYTLLAKASMPKRQMWAVPAGVHIGNPIQSENGRWELTLVLADRYLSEQYDHRFIEASAGDGGAKDLGTDLPPGAIVQDTIEVNRSSNCP
jgi:hypothetical protein